jgi:uncharacterized protein YecE (DUF72 family)
MADLFIGTSGWSYNDTTEKGGWVGSFYPNKSIKKLPFYSKYFNTAEFDAIYYKKFYENMGAKTFEGMVNATPAGFQFSVKVPETITREKKLGTDALPLFDEYLDRLSALKKAHKLGAILFQMSPNFTVQDFRSAEKFLDRLPRGYDYAVEFRHPSWQTEGAPELLRHYNIASVITDSADPKLKFLSEPIITADHVFIRFHGRKQGHWYNYLYSKDELKPWAEKVKKLRKDPEAKRLRVYFNNHPFGNAPYNALQFKEMIGEKLTPEQAQKKQEAGAYLTGKGGLDQWVA